MASSPAPDSAPVAEGDEAELTIDRIANGGEGVGRLAEGIVCFVAGAIPGDSVRVTISERRKRFSRGRLTAVLAPSPNRVEPGCPHVAEGCGGCDWQHVDRAHQRALKEQIVADALERIGRLPANTVEIATDPVEVPLAGRTTVRAIVDPLGRAGYRRRRSNVQTVVSECGVVHPMLEDLLLRGHFDGCHEVVLRTSASTGQRLVVGDPAARGVDLGNVGGDVDSIVVVGTDELEQGHPAHLVELIADREWRVSARSFFQNRPEGAERLVAVVRESVEALEPPPGPLIDLYAGVGLLGGAVARDRQLIAVESSPSAVADGRLNLADLDATMIEADVRRWQPDVSAAVVVADPARTGLEPEGVGVINATEASALVLVSCDAGSLGRDTRLLVESGWTMHGIDIIDMFPHTSHLETVSRFSR